MSSNNNILSDVITNEDIKEYEDYISNNNNSEILLDQTLDLSNATDANIEFWAKWNIETDYDYVQIMAAGSSGVYEPLCGIYTEIGTNYQDLNKPLYHGFQNNWVAERLSLIDFLGESSVNIKIRLVSDMWVNEDGFYFDDFKINVLSPALSKHYQSNGEILSIGQNQPNPAALKIYIPLNIPNNYYNLLDLKIYNIFDFTGLQIMHDIIWTLFSTGFFEI